MKKQWQCLLAGLVLATGVITRVGAEEPGRKSVGVKTSQVRTTRGPGYGFAAVLDKAVGLSAEQRDSVRGLLAEQRRQSQTLRDATDGKIRAMLTPEQQKKFDALLAEQKARRANRMARVS
jgi:hypothetical protein